MGYPTGVNRLKALPFPILWMRAVITYEKTINEIDQLRWFVKQDSLALTLLINTDYSPYPYARSDLAGAGGYDHLVMAPPLLPSPPPDQT